MQPTGFSFIQKRLTERMLVSQWHCYTDNSKSSSSSSWDRVVVAAAAAAADDDDDDAVVDDDSDDGKVTVRCWESALIACDIGLKSLTHWQLSAVSTFVSWLSCADVTPALVRSRRDSLSSAAALNASISNFCQTKPVLQVHYSNRWNNISNVMHNMYLPVSINGVKCQQWKTSNN